MKFILNIVNEAVISYEYPKNIYKDRVMHTVDKVKVSHHILNKNISYTYLKARNHDGMMHYLRFPHEK